MPLAESLRQRVRGGMRSKGHDAVTLAEEQQHLLAKIMFYCCVAFTVPLQILLLYDRGWQVQRWPVPVIVGSTIGWVVGLCLGTMVATSRTFQDQFDTKAKEHAVSK
jgi:putative effector of murein hydrolase